MSTFPFSLFPKLGVLSVLLPEALKTLHSVKMWLGILDILVVAYLFYRLLLLVRGSRALQIIGGLLTLLVGLWISDKMRLDTLNWLLRQVLPLGPVALVILFYPELRHALEEFGPRFWQKGWNLLQRDEEMTGAISAVVSAVQSLSAQCIGAIIVFERQTELDQVVETGTPMDSTLSPEILETIFYKGTSLHDGAVVGSGTTGPVSIIGAGGALSAGAG